MKTNWVRVLVAMTMTVAVTLGAAGCKEKGEAEKAGEKADKAAGDLKKGLTDAADKLKK